MNREMLLKWLRTRPSFHNAPHPHNVAAADLIDQQAARIAELEGDAAKAQEIQEEVYRIGRNHGWIAGRDAAADEIDCGCTYREQAIESTKHSRYSVCQQGECLARLSADIRALTRSEDKP
jgi:hypothetical protein